MQPLADLSREPDNHADEYCGLVLQLLLNEPGC